MELLSQLFPQEVLMGAFYRFFHLIPFMVLFGFLGHLLDLDNQRFREEEENKKKQKQKDEIAKYFS